MGRNSYICIICICDCGNRDDTNCGHAKTNMTQLQMKTKEYSYESYGICRFLPETHITPPFVLFIQTFFVKLKVNLHDLGKGQANMSVEPLIYLKNKWTFVLSIPVTAVNAR